MQRLPVTLALSAYALVITLLIGLGSGIIAALRQNTWVDQAAMVFAMIGISLPNFYLGLLMIIFFAVELRWLPTGGYIAFTDDPLGWLATSTMPAISLALLLAGLLARITRSTMLEVLRQDYIRTARAKGLPRRLVVVKHALANALIPITTVIGIIVSLLISGSVVTETLFSIPGIGQLLTQAVLQPRLSDGAGRPADHHRVAGAGEHRRRCLLRAAGPAGALRWRLTPLRSRCRRQIWTTRSRSGVIIPRGRRMQRLLHHRLFVTGLGAVRHHRDRRGARAMDRAGRSEPAGDAPEIPATLGRSTCSAPTISAARCGRAWCGARSCRCSSASAVVVINAVFGTLIGAAAGYFRALDNVLMRINDALMAFPAVLLAIGVTAVLGPSVNDVIIALGVVYTPRTARIVRSSVIVLREMEYVQAAVAAGAGHWRILRRHILPNAMAPLIVQLSFLFAYAVLTEATLSFLGVGAVPPTPTWGNIMAEGRQYMIDAPWIIAIPGAALMITVLGLNLLGDGLRDVLDPRLRIQQ